MKVLVACEFSGTVRDAFLAKGHEAISCDLLSTEKPGPHYQGDVLNLIYTQHFDLMIAHPPCTYLTRACPANSTDRNRRLLRLEALAFFKELLDCPIPKVCVENPVGAISTWYRKPDQVIHPFMFGHREYKRTCLWLKGLPTLKPTHDLKRETDQRPLKDRQRLGRLPPSKDRWKIRSKTFDGIAQAMADQWG